MCSDGLPLDALITPCSLDRDLYAERQAILVEERELQRGAAASADDIPHRPRPLDHRLTTSVHFRLVILQLSWRLQDGYHHL